MIGLAMEELYRIDAVSGPLGSGRLSKDCDRWVRVEVGGDIQMEVEGERGLVVAVIARWI